MFMIVCLSLQPPLEPLFTGKQSSCRFSHPYQIKGTF